MSQRNTTWSAVLAVVGIGSAMAAHSPAVHAFLLRMHGM